MALVAGVMALLAAAAPARAVQVATVTAGSRATLGALAATADGRVIGAGQAVENGRERVLVFRRLADGSADASFAGSGQVLASFGSSGDGFQRASAVAATADGGALVAGVADGRVFVARYRADGSLDPAFGAGGVSFVTREGRPYFGTSSGPAAIALLGDGRIVLAGAVPVPRGRAVLVARLTATGAADVTFNHSGVLAAQLGRRGAHHAPTSAARAMVVLGDGRLVLAGLASDKRGHPRAMLARVTTDGRLNRSFPRGDAALPGFGALNALVGDGAGGLLAGGTGGFAQLTADGARTRRVRTADPVGALAGTEPVAVMRRRGAVRVRRAACTGTVLGGASGAPRAAIGPDAAVTVGVSQGAAIALARLAPGACQ